MQQHGRDDATQDGAPRRAGVAPHAAWLLPPGLGIALIAPLLAHVLPPVLFRGWLVAMLALLAARALLFTAPARRALPGGARRILEPASLAGLGLGFGVSTFPVALPGNLWAVLAQTLWLLALATTALPGRAGAPRHGLVFALAALLPPQARLLSAGDPVLAALGVGNLVACAMPLLARRDARASTVDAASLTLLLARQTARRRRALLALREALRRARALSNVDALTGLANRRVLDRVLAREWARARREHRPVSLVVCDIDHFGPYVERYGQYAGDRCVERVATLVAARSRRAGDLVARYGAGAFVLLLPDASEFASLDIAESIRGDVLALTLLHGGSDAERVVTVSCGVATLVPGAVDPAPVLLEAAVSALGGARRAGGNRVCAAGTVSAPSRA